MGPDDLNGYGFLYMRLCWTGFGLQANIVEEYVVVERFTAHLCWFEANVGPEAVFGTDVRTTECGHPDLMLLTHMTIHLFQFRFADTEQYFLRPPPTLISWWPSWWITFDAVRAPSCSLRFV